MPSVPWIRLYTSFPRHRKTMALRRILGTSDPILGLWCWASENAPDGDLSGFTPEELETVSGWIGERGKAFKAICDVGFVDVVSDGVSANRYTLHEWEEHAGAGISSYLTRRERQRDIMRDRRSGSGEDQKEKKKKKKKSVSTLLALTPTRKKKPAEMGSPAFEEFYRTYPKRVSKGQAIKAWPGDELLPVILAALTWQAPTWDSNYTKNPATWLNARCWEDEKPQPSLFRQPAKNPSVGHMPASSEYPTKTGRLEMP